MIIRGAGVLRPHLRDRIAVAPSQTTSPPMWRRLGAPKANSSAPATGDDFCQILSSIASINAPDLGRATSPGPIDFQDRTWALGDE